MGSIGWGHHVMVADASPPVLADRDIRASETEEDRADVASARTEPCDSEDWERLLDPNFFINDTRVLRDASLGEAWLL